jgi:hypothetical protein
MKTISNIIFACCIFHDMILEDESDVSRLEYILRGLEDGIVQLER